MEVALNATRLTLGEQSVRKEAEEAAAAAAAKSSSDEEYETQSSESDGDGGGHDTEESEVSASEPTDETAQLTEEELHLIAQEKAADARHRRRLSSVQAAQALTFVMSQAKAAVQARRAQDPGASVLVVCFCWIYCFA